MTLKLIRNDITNMKTDAIVNAANEHLLAGGGVCGAIFRKAGYEKLTEACNEIGHCDTGKAVITSGFGLCRYIIHTVGPVYHGGNYGEAQLLRSCYLNSLELAKENGIESISFPIISSGIYGYPKDEAIMIASEAIQQFLADNEMEIYLVFYDRNSFLDHNRAIPEVDRFLYNNYQNPIPAGIYGKQRKSSYFSLDSNVYEEREEAVKPDRKLSYLLRQKEETFSEMLLRLIDEKGYTDVEVYKRANIDRKLFSKIRSNKNYQPSKPTVLALCIALKLSLDETRDLLKQAGFALTRSNKTDIIVEYFIDSKDYDIFTLNEVLFHYELPTL